MTTDSPKPIPGHEQAQSLVAAWLDEVEIHGARRERMMETARTTPGLIEAWLITACEIGMEAARRPDRSPAGEVRVKPLEWGDHGCGIWSAASDALDLSLYQISFEADAAFELDWFGDREPVMFPTLEAAKAAAQADYEARIRAALEHATAPERRHYSDCAVHNAPAYEPGPCDCGGYIPAPEREGLLVEAARGALNAYERDNPMRTADFCVPDCDCTRCSFDNLAAALAAYEEKRDG